MRRPFLSIGLVCALTLALVVTGASPAQARTRHTRVGNLYPLTRSFHLEHGWRIGRSISGQCEEGSGVATYAYYCTNGHGVSADPCFPMAGGKLVCPAVKPWEHTLLAIRPQGPVSGSGTRHAPIIASKLTSGARCFRLSHFDSFGSHRVSWYCGSGIYLLDQPAKHAHKRWTQSAVRYTRRGYTRAGVKRLSLAWVERGRCRKAGSDGGIIPICR